MTQREQSEQLIQRQRNRLGINAGLQFYVRAGTTATPFRKDDRAMIEQVISGPESELHAPHHLKLPQYAQLLGRLTSEVYGSSVLTIDGTLASQSDASQEIATSALAFHEPGYVFVDMPRLGNEQSERLSAIIAAANHVSLRTLIVLPQPELSVVPVLAETPLPERFYAPTATFYSAVTLVAQA